MTESLSPMSLSEMKFKIETGFFGTFKIRRVLYNMEKFLKNRYPDIKFGLQERRKFLGSKFEVDISGIPYQESLKIHKYIKTI